MMLSKAVAMQAHFAPATQSDTHEFFSSFTKGLRDSRAATHRDPVAADNYLERRIAASELLLVLTCCLT